MPLTSKSTQTKNTCSNCGFVMVTDSAATKYRCGFTYFQQPANTRKQERMDNYPEVAHDSHCGHWEDHIPTVLE